MDVDTTSSSDEPMLSICVPTYRRSAMLERALGSLEGTAADVAARTEIVVSDNSPQEDRAEALKRLDAWPGPTRYLANERNIGAVPNFNRAGMAASGRYLLFLHDDDELLEGAIDSMVGAVSAAPQSVAAFLFGVDVADEAGRVRRRQVFPTFRVLPPKAAMRQLVSDSSFVRMPAVVIRRDVFADAGGFDASVGSPTDFELMIRVFSQHGVACVPALTARYTVHRDTATTGMFNRETLATLLEIYARAEATGLLEPDELARAKRDFFHQFILGGTYRAMRRGDLAEARTILALFSEPSIRALGASRRWWPVRAAFAILTRVPAVVAAPLLRWLGRRNLERLWHP